MTTPIQHLAQEVYDNAVELFKAQYTQSEEKRRWLTDKHTLGDVQEAILAAKAKYDARTQSKARKRLQKFSASFMYYGRVVDMLVQQQPEYVSLAWGTTKLLFILVMNHEELTSELAKALSRIADVLPRIECDLILYPTDEMKHKMEDLYALLIKFYQRALKWYEASGPKHALASFIKPYKLHFEDIVEMISERTRSIENLAITMARKEIRDIYVLVKQCLDEQKALAAEHNRSNSAIANIEQAQIHTYARLVELQQLQQSHHTVTSGVLMNTQRLVRDGQVAHMISAALSSAVPSPHDCLKRLIAFHSRPRGPARTHADCFWKDKALESWIASPSASLLLVAGSVNTNTSSQVLATYLTETVRSAELPIMWALRASKREILLSSQAELLKYLVTQALQKNSANINEKISANFNASRVASAQTEQEWLKILDYALVGLQCVYLVIDAAFMGSSLDLQEFIRLLQDFLSRQNTVIVKIIVFTYQKRYGTYLNAQSANSTGTLTISLDKVLSNPSRQSLAPKGMKAAMRQPYARMFTKRLHQHITVPMRQREAG